MALLFTILLGVSTLIISYYFFAQDFNLKIASSIIIALMSIVVLVSFVISSFVVKRINTIAETAREIMETGDLSRRISIDTNWDDLSNLAQLLNSFLARNESLMDGIREISNNIAHDLRTPLTHLRNQIEGLKTDKISEQDLDALLNEADQILAIFHSLLRISNIEKGKRYQPFDIIDITALMHDVVELYEPVAEEKNIRLNLQLPENIKVKGDRNLLFQLFTNLLSNALKFSPINNEVFVIAGIKEDRLHIKISDNGPGIAEAEKELVFRRFYRSDASRSTEGNGLGLSLAKAIADLHNAIISLEDNRPGLIARVTLQSYQ